MTRYWRAAHLRSSPSGGEHWVAGHWVEREAWDASALTVADWERSAWLAGTRWTKAHLDGGQPNAACPRCQQPVWFYRNSSGGCAYFDEIGKPWPKHPCMDSPSTRNRTAAWQAAVEYRDAYDISEPDLELEEIIEAFERLESARAVLSIRNWDWDLRVAKSAVSAALDDALRPSRGSANAAAVRKKNERWKEARIRLERLESEYGEAKREAAAARANYGQVLTGYSTQT